MLGLSLDIWSHHLTTFWMIELWFAKMTKWPTELHKHREILCSKFKVWLTYIYVCLFSTNPMKRPNLITHQSLPYHVCHETVVGTTVLTNITNLGLHFWRLKMYTFVVLVCTASGEFVVLPQNKQYGFRFKVMKKHVNQCNGVLV